jgi:hypothetical protein
MTRPTKGRKAKERNPQEGKNNGRARTAADIKALTARLAAFTHDQLAAIPIVPVGIKLKQGAVYLDLRDAAPVPFTASGEMTAGEINYYTPKAEVPYEYWNRLIEVLSPGQVQGAATSQGADRQPFSPQRAGQEAAVEQSRAGELSGEAPGDAKIDEAAAESFPASDPPSWTTGPGKNIAREIHRDDLDSLSDEELRERARQLNVPGREGRTREQLIRALRG